MPNVALGNFLSAIATVLGYLLDIYMWIIIGRAIISWVNPDPYNPIVRFLYQATEPVLYRIRRILPEMGGIDLSPMAVIIAIIFIKRFLIATLIEMAFRVKLGGGV